MIKRIEMCELWEKCRLCLNERRAMHWTRANERTSGSPKKIIIQNHVTSTNRKENSNQCEKIFTLRISVRFSIANGMILLVNDIEWCFFSLRSVFLLGVFVFSPFLFHVYIQSVQIEIDNLEMNVLTFSDRSEYWTNRNPFFGAFNSLFVSTAIYSVVFETKWYLYVCMASFERSLMVDSDAMHGR